MSRRIWPILAATGLSAAFLVTAHLLVNGTLMLYDDEGYILQSYRIFVAGGRLYDEVFTQYGPWPYLYHWLASLGSAEALTHTFGRALTVWHWTLSALLTGIIAWQVTGRQTAATGAALLAFGYLGSMTHEPSHPGSLICALLALAVSISLSCQSTVRWRWLGATGGITAALLLTKINVGLFFIAGIGAAALLFTAWPERWRPWTHGTAVAGLLILPWGLMAGRLTDGWVLIFACLFSLAAAGVWWILPIAVRDRPVVPPAVWPGTLVAFGGTLLLIGVFPLLRGTSVSALLHGVLTTPLRMPAHFVLGLSWPAWMLPLVIGCGLLTAQAGRELRRTGEISRMTATIVHAVRTGALLLLLLHVRTWLTNPGWAWFLMLCLPLTPIFLIRAQVAASPATGRSLAWLALLALPQVLHAYPVAGSQKAWGTFLLLPLFVAGWTDTWGCLTERAKGLPRMVAGFGHALLPLAGALQLGLLLQTGWIFHRSSQPLGLPGAESLRPPAQTRLALRTLTLNAALHADVLFSRPGMFSYNLWSGVPTPTAQNATHWFWLLDEPAQQAIVARLRETPRAAVITSQLLDEFLGTINVPMTGLLQDHLLTQYRLLFSLPTTRLNFWVPHASRAVPFGRVDVLLPAATQSSPGIPLLLQTNVALDGELRSVTLRTIEPPWTDQAVFGPQNSRLVLEPITPQGESIGAAIELPLSTPVRGLFRLSLYLAHRPVCLDRPTELVLTGIDPTGKTLSESLF
jgi:hypothetical protein